MRRETDRICPLEIELLLSRSVMGSKIPVMCMWSDDVGYEKVILTNPNDPNNPVLKTVVSITSCIGNFPSGTHDAVLCIVDRDSEPMYHLEDRSEQMRNPRMWQLLELISPLQMVEISRPYRPDDEVEGLYIIPNPIDSLHQSTCLVIVPAEIRKEHL